MTLKSSKLPATRGGSEVRVSLQLGPLNVLYEDNHLLAVSKPAQLPTMGVAADRPSLLTEAKEYIRKKYNKAGNVYLGVVSRLDAPVTGVLLLARTSKAAKRLNEQFRCRTVEKNYWALTQGQFRTTPTVVEHFLRHDERHRRVHVCNASASGAKLARLQFVTLRKLNDCLLQQVQPETGRKHQIRVQLAHVGQPILGDRKYGGTLSFRPGIALHARKLVFVHPVQEREIELVAPLPESWRRMGVDEKIDCEG